MADLLGIPFNSMHGKLYRAQKRYGEEALKSIEYQPILFHAAVVDIETTDLHAGGMNGHMICGCIKPLGGDIVVHQIAFEDSRNDARLLQEFIGNLSNYEILIGHNITAFDLNWLFTRLSYHNIPYPTKRWLIYDTYQAARRMALKAERKSLAFLCDFFRIDYIKTSVLPVSWSMIDSPDRAEFDQALYDIVFHCQKDVESNEMLFYALYPRDRSLASLPVYKR